MNHEILSDLRQDRCIAIAEAIHSHWKATNSFDYSVRTTEPLTGDTIDSLKTQYFEVCVGSEKYEIPYTDLILTFMEVSRLDQIRRGITTHESVPRCRTNKALHDEEAASVLNQLEILVPGAGRLRLDREMHD